MEKENVGWALPNNQIKCHSKLDLESHHLLLRNNKILNQVQDDRRRGFTLIELLVVVLILGILAAVALPQYQKAVERSRMAEAVFLVRAIARAHQAYYLEEGKLLESTDWDKLALTIPGEVTDSSYSLGKGRLRTKHFVYAVNSSYGDWLASAYRVQDADGGIEHKFCYHIWIEQSFPEKIQCSVKNGSCFRPYQRVLCEKLNDSGIL